jgi:hypothetical protein
MSRNAKKDQIFQETSELLSHESQSSKRVDNIGSYDSICWNWVRFDKTQLNLFFKQRFDRLSNRSLPAHDPGRSSIEPLASAYNDRDQVFADALGV